MLVPARPLRSSREVLRELGRHAIGLGAQSEDEDLASAEIGAIEHMLEELQAPLDRFVHTLHPVVAFGIMPAFALANAGVAVSGMGLGQLLSPVALGAALGLLIGKQVGIFLVTLGAVRIGLAPIPGNSSIAKLYGVSMVAGIGFTVALFIATLAFPGGGALLDQAKLGILLGSTFSGIFGLLALRMTAPVGAAAKEPDDSTPNSGQRAEQSPP